MALYEVATGKLKQVDAISFVAEGIKERQELQQWLLGCPDALGEDLFVIAEEFGDWEDSRRRIDILALDREGNLTVIELKRTDDGGHMDLQAVRYAAMISSMSFEDVIRAHEEFSAARNIEGNARERICKFLDVPLIEPYEISSIPRIVLVAQDFSLEITTTVLWLVERGVDIRCVQAAAYRVNGGVFIDFKQILPLREASEYQVKIRQKDENVRRTASGTQRERTLPVLARHGLVKEGTEIELVQLALPEGADKMDPRLFRARIVDIESRESVQWLFDQEHYSASKLSHMLRDEHGIKWLANNIFIHWRIAGDTESMWNRAEALTRGERFKHAGQPNEG